MNNNNQNNGPSTKGKVVPIAPFMMQVFGDSLSTEEGRMAAVEYMQENKDEFNALFQKYVDAVRNRGGQS